MALFIQPAGLIVKTIIMLISGKAIALSAGHWPLTGYLLVFGCLLLATGDWPNRFVRHSRKESNQRPEASNPAHQSSWIFSNSPRG
jgi:hypothetical protein